MLVGHGYAVGPGSQQPVEGGGQKALDRLRATGIQHVKVDGLGNTSTRLGSFRQLVGLNDFHGVDMVLDRGRGKHAGDASPQ